MDAKTIQKYKGKSVSALLNLATTHFNEYIRLRDSTPMGDKRWGVCISSGQKLIVPSVNAQAGHFYSGGKFPTLRFNENNVNLQGKSDNYFNSGNQLEYRKNLIQKIGLEEVEELDRMASQSKGQSHKWDRIYLIEVIETYKQKKKMFK